MSALLPMSPDSYESDLFIEGKSIVMFLHKLHSFVMLSCHRSLLWKKQLLKYVCESLEGSSHLIETGIKCNSYIFGG
jgi:hypothetical protein